MRRFASHQMSRGTVREELHYRTAMPELHLEDDNLISSGLQGDREAFNVLFSKYRQLLYRLAYRVLYNHEEAEDAVQKLFLRATASWKGLNTTALFEVGWRESSSTKRSAFCAIERIEPRILFNRSRINNRRIRLIVFRIRGRIQSSFGEQTVGHCARETGASTLPTTAINSHAPRLLGIHNRGGQHDAQRNTDRHSNKAF